MKASVAFTRTALVVLVAIGCVAGCRRDSGGAAAPVGGGCNVLLITLDTTRADRLGCYGYTAAETPNLDRLAAEGVRFEQCVTCVPITLPAHASMMTATYPFHHGVRDNGKYRLHGGNVTLAELLSRAGYDTAAVVGSFVLNGKYGVSQGFDRYVDLATPAEQVPDLHGHGSERKASEVADLAIQQLEVIGDRRFFLWVHFFDPHWPYAPPEPYRSSHQDGYNGEVAYMDAEVGRVLDALEQRGLDDKTLVVVVGDHGEGLGEHNEDAHSFFVYETTMRVPLVARCPGRLPAGRVVREAVRTVDLMPTILEFLGESAAMTARVHGESVLPLMTGAGGGTAREAYGETLRPQEVFEFSPLRCIWADGWKYVHAPTPELYHVVDDAGEASNLAADEPQRVADMRERLRDLIAEAEPPYWLAEVEQAMSAEERARLESLGYVTGDGGAKGGGRELESFESGGADMKDHAEVVRLWSFAAAAWQAGQMEAAEQLYGQLVERVPGMISFRTRLAEAQSRQGKTAAAIATLEAAAALAPDDPSVREALDALSATGQTLQPATGPTP